MDRISLKHSDSGQQSAYEAQSSRLVHKGTWRVAPTIFRNEPFGENVEGLSHCGDKSCGSQIVFK